jgi:hypothetical protein
MAVFYQIYHYYVKLFTNLLIIIINKLFYHINNIMFDFEFIYIVISSVIGIACSSYSIYSSYKNIKNIQIEDKSII